MKYSEEIKNEICKYLRQGNNTKDSCVLAGISRDTYYRWIEEKSDFSDAIKKRGIPSVVRTILQDLSY